MPQTLRLFQIDSFAEKTFAGNPAAVVPLESWLPDSQLQAIASENNLSETAFFVPKEEGFHIRWFTPACEAPLCGHATLAAAYVLFNDLEPGRDKVSFESMSGPLHVEKDASRLVLNFPAWILEPCEPPRQLVEGLGKKPKECFAVHTDKNYYAVFETEDDIVSAAPDLSRLAELAPYGTVITAPGTRSDCASRYFAPSAGIPEDPVTGSIHSALVPYWSKRLGKKEILAKQLSKRGGVLYCEDRGERVRIAGNAVKYLEGTISI